MTAALPPPMTPPASNLQDFKFMPLHVVRLRDSDLASEASAEACWYAVLLWSVSWHQVPAGSLPDNDLKITKLLGLGKDLRTFIRVKAEAMRGWVKCSDGLLYHPTVAEMVNVAWEGKVKQRWETACARIKKHNQRTGENLPKPTYQEFAATYSGDVSPGTSPACPPGRPAPVPRDVPRDTTPNEGGRPSGNSIQGKGIEKGIGTETVLDSSLPPIAAAQPTPAASEEAAVADVAEPDFPPLFLELWAAYPRVKGRQSRKLAHAQWKRIPAAIRPLLPAAAARYAKDGKEPKMECGAQGLHLWLRDAKFEDWLVEAAAEPKVAPPPPFKGPADLDIRAAVVERAGGGQGGEAFARNYLDPAKWRAERGQRAIVTANAYAEGQLRKVLGAWAAHERINIITASQGDQS